MPCVIYLHGNSSSRIEGFEAMSHLILAGITVLCFDFAGCGLSEGEYISLGWHEREDLALIIDHLRKQRRASAVALWGRSMGAATALLHADRDASIAAVVLDSAFAALTLLVRELSSVYAKYIPNFIV